MPGACCLIVRNAYFALEFAPLMENPPTQHSADRGDRPSPDLSPGRIIFLAFFPSRETLCSSSAHFPLLPFIAMQPPSILFGGGAAGGAWV